MSFALTTPQILARTKTVTRRLGWRSLTAGTLIQAVEKSQGLRKGQHVRKLAVLRVTDVNLEVLADGLSTSDVAREGFPTLTRHEFIDMFCNSHRGCFPSSIVTRIAFEYMEASA
jgi:hypothetical protein